MNVEKVFEKVQVFAEAKYDNGYGYRVLAERLSIEDFVDDLEYYNLTTQKAVLGHYKTWAMDQTAQHDAITSEFF